MNPPIPPDPSLPAKPLPTEPHPHKPWHKQIYFWVVAGVVLGVMYGFCFPTAPTSGQFSLRRPGTVWEIFPVASAFKPIAEGFISLIKMLIAPIIFMTVVAGIASVGDLRKVGRVGLKALVYFELVTTLAMLIALAVVHVAKPGVGVNFKASAADVQKAGDYNAAAQKQNATDFILHIIPKTLVGAFADGDILQVLLVSILVGVSLAQMGEKAQPLLHAIHLISQALFAIVGYLVWLAPAAAFAAIAATVGESGLTALAALLKMMGCVYATCLLFVSVVLTLLAYLNGFSMWKYLLYIKDEILLVLGTSSSESALPPIMAKMERVGCAQSVVGIVLPAGYSFNLDGTSIYLAMSVVFLAQVTNTPMSFGTELELLGLLLLTSKGAAAVTGGGFITLAATLSATHNTALVAGLAVLLGIDRFMSEARAITNLIGNGLATLIIAKSEHELDYAKAGPVLLEGRAGALAPATITLGPTT